MSARGKYLGVLLLACATSACAPDSAPTPEGVGPGSNRSLTPAPARAPVELAQPETPRSIAPPPPSAPEASGAPVPIDPDIADLGPFDVIGWDEAVSRAAQRITPENAEAELATLRGELENRP